MDVLSDILDSVRLKGSLYFSTEFRPPWGLRVPKFLNVARFHLVMQGTCWVEVEGKNEAILLERGDLVVIPYGAQHRLTDTPETKCLSVDKVVELAGFTGTGALVFGGSNESNPTKLVCGHLAFDSTVRHPFLENLPRAIVVRWSDYANRSALNDVFRFITREVAGGQSGSSAVINRLSEVLFIEAIRFWADTESRDEGLLAALADPHLGPLISAVHRNPADAWNLESMARAAGLSRTLLAERFRKVVGLSPMRYVAFWRMQVAKRLLDAGRLSVEEVANKVGYESGPSFTRSFGRIEGMSPGQFRGRTRTRST